MIDVILQFIKKGLKKKNLLRLLDRLIVLAILVAFGISSFDFIIAYLILSTII